MSELYTYNFNKLYERIIYHDLDYMSDRESFIVEKVRKEIIYYNFNNLLPVAIGHITWDLYNVKVY